MGVTVELDEELARALREAALREGIEPEALVVDAVRDRIGNRAPARAAREKGLLAAIAAGLPEPVWNRYRALGERRRAGTLTPGEQDELIGLIDQVESWYARRVALVAELATLRKEPFPDVMRRLGLTTPGDG